MRFLTTLFVILPSLFGLTSSQNSPPTFIGCSSINPTYLSGTCSGLLLLQEEAPINTVLFTVSATDPENDPVEFIILGDATLLYWLKLVLNKAARTANVVVNSRIDRESISTALTSLTLQMNDGNGNTINIPGISVFLVDINDNLPEFKNLPYRWEVPENTIWTSKTSFNVTMTDADVTQPTYKFVYVYSDSVANAFNETLRTASAQTSPLTGYQFLSIVSLMHPLDYESTRFYQVSVYAIEQSANGRNATTDIVLNVLDQQDTPPIFEGTPYITSVTENTPIGTTVYTVSAKDGDRGVPNPIEYFFDTSSSSTAVQLAALFSLNRTNGRVQVAANIDRESSLISSVYASFSLTIVASEVSAVSQPANISQTSTTLTISILDVADNAPTFGQSNYNGTVLENTAAGIPITLLSPCTVTDLDDRDNSAFNLTVTKNGSVFNVLDVTPVNAAGSASVSLRVQDSAQLDYETIKFFVLEVVARETKTVAKLSSTATVTVFILDANDNPPIFNQTKYTYSIVENSPNGAYVGQVWATDLDSGSYGQIAYSLGGTGSNRFKIDPSTGRILVAVNADADLTLIDRESSSVLYLTVQATDGGGWTGIAQLEVTLLDLNDNRPTFPSGNFTYTRIKESYPTDYEIDSLRATDKDIGLNSAVSYELQAMPGQSNISLRFFKLATVNASDAYYAKLTINDTLIGQIGWYNLTLIARDGGTPQLTGTTALTFYIGPADNGYVQDDSAIGRFRSALISTTLILIGGAALCLLMLIRTYFKSQSIIQMYNQGLMPTPRVMNTERTSASTAVHPLPPMQTSLPPTSEKHLPAVENSNNPDESLLYQDANPVADQTFGVESVESSNPGSENNPLFPRSFTLLKINPAGTVSPMDHVEDNV